MGEKISFHILSESFEYFGYLYLNIYFKKFIYSYMFEKINENFKCVRLIEIIDT